MKKILINEEQLSDNIIYYHGTNSDIKVSDLKNFNLAGDYGEGIYLTSSEKEAMQHGKNILKMKVDAKNPLIIGSKEYFEKIYPEISMGGFMPKMYLTSKSAVKHGFTSIIVDKPESTWQILLPGAKIHEIQ